MKRVIICLLLVLPAGCASNQAGGGVQAYCEQQARNDPDVVRWTMASIGHTGPDDGLAGRARLAQRQALQRCLRAQGAPMPGGVEPVVRQ